MRAFRILFRATGPGDRGERGALEIESLSRVRGWPCKQGSSHLGGQAEMTLRSVSEINGRTLHKLARSGEDPLRPPDSKEERSNETNSLGATYCGLV